MLPNCVDQTYIKSKQHKGICVSWSVVSHVSFVMRVATNRLTPSLWRSLCLKWKAIDQDFFKNDMLIYVYMMETIKPLSE